MNHAGHEIESGTPAGLPTWQPQVLESLWDEQRSVALEAAEALYQRDSASEPEISEITAEVAADFWRRLTTATPHRPETTQAQYDAVARAVWSVLRAARTDTTRLLIEDYVTVALRPIRRLGLGDLTAEVCATLHDFHRGRWNRTRSILPSQNIMQTFARNTLQSALARTLATLPAESLGPFWSGLHSREPALQQAMRKGLDYLSAEHAVPHLLRGLEEITDHHLRHTIVDKLEQIADVSAIATLHRLRRETAATDWTLSRHIARAIRVIEHQNRGHEQRQLLRPAQPAEPETNLLRPVAPTSAQEDQEMLVRPASPTDESDR